MTGTRFHRPALALFASAIFAIVVANPVAAATNWSGPLVLASAEYVEAKNVVALDDGHVVAMYYTGDGGRYMMRRSSDSGLTWRTPVGIGRSPDEVKISGRDGRVDVVTLGADELVYQRSRDYGKSLSAPMSIAGGADRIVEFAVEAGPGDMVAVWWQRRDGRAYVRFSVDGGAKFGPRRSIPLTDDGSQLDLAIGAGVVYVSYQGDSSIFDLYVIRALDFGESWTRPARLTRDGLDASLTAEGDRAYVAYADWGGDSNAKFMTMSYRGTIDRGATWSAPRNIVENELDADFPLITLRDDVLHATYARCRPLWDSCDDTRTMYRRSLDGVSWSAQTRLSERDQTEASPAAITAADGRVFVLFTGCDLDPVDYNQWHCRVLVNSARVGGR